MEVIKGYEDSEDSAEFKSSKCIDLMNILYESAPEIELTQINERKRFLMDPSDKVMLYNPKYEELYAPVIGPANPFKNSEQKKPRNMYNGYVQPANVNDAMFDDQRLTFHTYGKILPPTTIGYAVDPTVDKPLVPIGDIDASASHGRKYYLIYLDRSVTEMKLKPVKRTRKVEPRGTPDDINNFKGPWAQFVDEVKSSRPNDDQMEILHQWIKEKEAKKEIVKKQEEPEMVSEITQAVDYQARSFMVPPQDIGVNFRSDEPPERCYLPTKHLFTWRGHLKGITALRLIPKTGHLMLSGSADTTVKLWECYKERRLIMTYKGHHDPIKDLCFDNDGKRFLTCSLDRYIKLWDTETGVCTGRFTTNKIANCIRFNPDEDKQNLFIGAMADKKMITWDINANEIVQEYDRDIPVDSKYIADPSMHSMPIVTLSPDGRYLACQSLDNKIVIYDVVNRIREKRRKVFRGHVLSGNHCQIFFSPDQRYIMCGDGEGKLNILHARLKVHLVNIKQ
ncbi:hypothetical protein MXB_4547, partial [Myxobolus squamalis]